MTGAAPTAAGRVPRTALNRALAAAVGAGVFASIATAAEPAQAILQELRSFRELGSVLYIAAHPDDENTQLIAYLARGRGYRTAYLSVTRGDGGQNALGPEFGDELGVIRTQELLAARRGDGGRQFFTRAKDFGFSKDYRQTLTKWDHEQVLSDIVRVIRIFRPDVLITRFSTEPGTTHGHHTASAALALEAFRLAGDPKAFPDQLRTLAPWQPRRILWNNGWPGRGGGEAVAGDLHVEIGGNDPVTGESFGSIAAHSLSMHKTQGLGNFAAAIIGSGPRLESFRLLAGEPATGDILDGVDSTWGRVPGAAEVGRMADGVIAQFNLEDPSASVPALLALHGQLAALAADPVVDEKRRLLDRILQACLGLSVETSVAQAEVVPGEELKLRHTAVVRSATPVRWVAVRYPGTGRDISRVIEMHPNESAVREATWTLPAATPLSQPYWLREEGTPGMFRVDDPALIGLPETPPVLPVEDVFMVGGQTLVVADEAVQVTRDPAKGDIRRRLDAIPPVSLGFASSAELFAPGASRDAVVEVVASRAGAAGTLRLDAPEGWRVSPANQAFRLAAVGDRARLSFTVTAPPRPATGRITARAQVDGGNFSSQRVVIQYGHIPPQLLQPPASLKAISLELAIRGHSVGYLPGSRDSVAECLEQMGYAVTQLTGADLTAERLKNFDSVVIGVRAFNIRTDLAAQLPALFAYVEAGGVVVEQYNTPNTLQSPQLAPYTIKLDRSLPRYRVTDEKAPVTILEPAHPAFNVPNRIVPADFDGWVQERGLDFASEWDAAHFTPLLACSDAGEAPLKGGLLVARYGRGYFVYTGLSFFRQLPAGVPGAYRLFANLVSLGR